MIGPMRRTSLLKLLLLALLLGGALAWVRIDRALAGLPPSSWLRDQLQRQHPLLALPLNLLLPAPPRLDAAALGAWRPPPVPQGRVRCGSATPTACVGRSPPRRPVMSSSWRQATTRSPAP